MMAVSNLKSKLDGNKLDLSLNELVDVPVKELAAIPKATHIDLSINKLKVLPPQFATLTHIVELDLSKNELTELPKNFGNLNKLQNLDLYGNQLTTLPVSFARLKNLRWLDLKNNPLNPALKAVAGDCLDKRQCEQCAKRVVEYMQNIESDLEREKQKRLKEEREKEARRKAEEERELLKQKQEKKAAREKKKIEQKQQHDRLRREKEKEALLADADSLKTAASRNGDAQQLKSSSRSSGFGCVRCAIYIVLLLAVLFATVLGYHIYTGHKVESLSDVENAFRESWIVTERETKSLWKRVHPHVRQGWEQFHKHCVAMPYKFLSTNAAKGLDVVKTWLNSFSSSAPNPKAT